jgi:hypothetical protein
VSACSVQQGPGHPEGIKKVKYFNVLQERAMTVPVPAAGVFLPGGKIFPPKGPGLIGIDQGGPRLPRLGSDYK